MSTTIHTSISQNDHPDKQVPFGYWYTPNEEQLVQTLVEFVEGKLTPEQLSTDRSFEYVTDTDTYGFHPRILNWDPKKGMYDNVRYCCIRRQKITGNAKRRTDRKTGSGNFWKNTGTCDEGICRGKAQKLKLTLVEEEITWIMHEYTLKAKSNHFQEWAVCRIERKTKNNNDKEKGTASRIRKKRKKEGIEESGSGFNMQGQDCGEQKVDDPTKNTVVEHESVTIVMEHAMKNSSDIELLEENSKYTEESVRRNMQCLQDYLDQGVDDDPMININNYPLYKELKQILQDPNNLDDDHPMNILLLFGM